MAPIPLDLVLSAIMGASLALASRRSLPDQPLWRTPALWALVAIELTLVLPSSAYLLWRQPSWAMMYLVEPEVLGLPAAGWALVPPLAGIGGFLATRRLLLAARLFAALLVLVGAGLVAALVVSFGSAQLGVVGTTAGFRADPSALRPLTDSPLVYVLPATVAAILSCFGFTVWRLILLGLAHRDQKATAELVAAKPAVSRGPTRKRKVKTNGEVGRKTPR